MEIAEDNPEAFMGSRKRDVIKRGASRARDAVGTAAAAVASVVKDPRPVERATTLMREGLHMAQRSLPRTSEIENYSVVTPEEDRKANEKEGGAPGWERGGLHGSAWACMESLRTARMGLISCPLHAPADAYYADKFLTCSDRYIEVNKADFEIYVAHELESESRAHEYERAWRGRSRVGHGREMPWRT